jgi:hypothetical protein
MFIATEDAQRKFDDIILEKIYFSQLQYVALITKAD